MMIQRRRGEVAPLTPSARLPLEFRLLHLMGFLLTLPLFAVARLVPHRRGQRRDENVFAETNRSVLTALGIAFTA